MILHHYGPHTICIAKRNDGLVVPCRCDALLQLLIHLFRFDQPCLQLFNFFQIFANQLGHRFIGACAEQRSIFIKNNRFEQKYRLLLHAELQPNVSFSDNNSTFFSVTELIVSCMAFKRCCIRLLSANSIEFSWNVSVSVELPSASIVRLPCVNVHLLDILVYIDNNIFFGLCGRFKRIYKNFTTIGRHIIRKNKSDICFARSALRIYLNGYIYAVYYAIANYIPT